MEHARTRVVGAAILRGGRVLATRRTSPPHLAGRWEFPGGKVEPGEVPTLALEREIAEELGCDIEVTGWLAGEVPIGTGLVLTVATARLVGTAEPEPVEHDAARWLSVEELGEVDWLEPDRPFLAEVADILASTAQAHVLAGPRAILFDEDDARAVQARLRADGYEADVVRERLAGEDDDEDHPWAVLSDAPELVLEVLVDEYDGWLDVGDSDPPPAPLDLPAQPRRLKRP